MSVLWIARVDVTEPEGYGRYAKLAGPALALYGGEFLARGGAYTVLEGQARTRNVVARFPSMEAAVTAYNSPEYQEALSHAEGACIRDIIVLEEVAPA